VEPGLAAPARQGRAIKINPGAGVDLGLTVHRQVISIFAHQHVRDQRLGRQPALDEVRRRQRLNDARLACPTCILWADGDDHLELRRDDIETLGAVLADLRHLTAPARAERGGWPDHTLDPRQVLRQAAYIALSRITTFGWITRLNRCIRLGDRRLQVFEQKVELVGIEFLGALCVKSLVELLHQILKARIVGAELGILVFEPRLRLTHRSVRRVLVFPRLTLRPDHGLLCKQHVPDIGRERRQIERGEYVGHGYDHNLLRASAAAGRANLSVMSHSATAGGSTFGVCTLRQSRLAKSASNWATESFMTPSRMGGQAKLPCSRRL